MATHSSVLAWRIPGMWEPGGLPCNLNLSPVKIDSGKRFESFLKLYLGVKSPKASTVLFQLTLALSEGHRHYHDV